MNAQLTEIMRLITNLIRTGVVTEVDRENWLCRVKTGDLETNWINWLTLRAGNARTWWKPSEGEQVVLLSLGGKRSRAITWWGRMKTCWYLIALMPTGATLNGQRKCSGNACNVALRHSRYNWRKGGQISTRKCL